MNKNALTKPAVIWTAAALLLFLIIPWVTCLVIKSDAAMAVCFILWYAIDPVFAIAAGMFAGKRPRELWFLPLLLPVLFLISTRICFAPDPAYMGYALMYALLGGTTMLVFFIMTNGKR